jgi:isocitrate dehydrogenase (NAD+)
LFCFKGLRRISVRRFFIYRLAEFFALFHLKVLKENHMKNTIFPQIPATLIPGDGIGPEVVEATVQVLDALGSPFSWDVQQAGMAGVNSCGDPLPAATLASIRKNKLALKGPLTTPIGEGFRSSNVRLREEFQLYANVRPALTIVPGRYENIDLVLVRENLGGFYVAHEYYVPVGDDPRAVAVATGVNTRDGCKRIARFAFEYAVKNGRKKITIVHKANILKALTGIFLEAAREVAREYENQVQMNDMIVDACAMQLVLNPWQFDMLLCTNLFGDILSDQLAGLVGGLGMAPGANVGDDTAIFEAVHGSAPDIAGRGIANPISLMLAAGLMLEHVGRHDLAQRLRTAITETLNTDQVRTGDLKGTASTRQFADAIVRRLAMI